MRSVGLKVLGYLATTVLTVYAQPSPKVQERISNAIKNAASATATGIDYTSFVNPFIGTGE
jgi:hypothetical protein